MNKGLTEVSPVSNKKYFDYVACAHSHYNEKYTENDVYYTQASAYGERMYKSTFTVSKGNVTNCVVEDLNYSTITNSVTTIDSNISNIIASYAKDYSSVGSTVVASSTSGTFYKNNHMPNLLCKAMYTEARKQGYVVDMACTNDARYNLTGSSWTYSSLYEAFPFDNTVYIAKIKGSKNVRELCKYNYRYHDSSLTSMDFNTWYTVAVIDYLLFHTDSSRDYDYFSFNSSNMQIIGSLKKSNGDTYIYRDICSDYVKTLSGTIYASNYNITLDEFKAPSIPLSY
jgi:2',3'-cyclic-nucleotide 2'-phosphodiesterase (5'-nucleotidase family)